MDAYANDHGPEGEMFYPPDLQVLETVVVQKTVIDPFASGSVLVDVFKQVGVPRDGCMEPEVTVFFDVYSPAVSTRRTFLFIGA